MEHHAACLTQQNEKLNQELLDHLKIDEDVRRKLDRRGRVEQLTHKLKVEEHAAYLKLSAVRDKNASKSPETARKTKLVQSLPNSAVKASWTGKTKHRVKISCEDMDESMLYRNQTLNSAKKSDYKPLSKRVGSTEASSALSKSYNTPGAFSSSGRGAKTKPFKLRVVSATGQKWCGPFGEQIKNVKI